MLLVRSFAYFRKGCKFFSVLQFFISIATFCQQNSFLSEGDDVLAGGTGADTLAGGGATTEFSDGTHGFTANDNDANDAEGDLAVCFGVEINLLGAVDFKI